MTTAEAYEYINAGGQVRHATWSMDVYAFMKDDVLYVTNDVHSWNCPPLEFFSNNWQIYTK